MKQKISPSGKYVVEFISKPTNGFLRDDVFVKRIDTNKIIHSLYDVPLSTALFFNKNNEEWLLTGEHYMLQTFINLDKEIVYDNNDKDSKAFKNGYAFCVTDIRGISKNGDIIILSGCIWAFPYEIRFYDLSNPENGWPELCISDINFNDKLTGLDGFDLIDYKIQINDDNTFTFKKYMDNIGLLEIIACKSDNKIILTKLDKQL